MKELSDEQILENFNKGDRGAFDLIIERYHKQVYRLAYKFTRNQKDAEDVTQDTFMRAYENMIKHPKEELNMKAWLMTICVNLCRNLAKKKKSFNFADFETEDDDRLFVDSVQDEKALGPAEKAKKKEQSKLVQEAIAQLKPKYQVVLQLRYTEDLSYNEIAETLDIPINTVKIHLKRAKEQLIFYLDPHG
jgi:RNA polymerase sigma-70 factor (ECF subfamily)